MWDTQLYALTIDTAQALRFAWTCLLNISAQVLMIAHRVNALQCWGEVHSHIFRVSPPQSSEGASEKLAVTPIRQKQASPLCVIDLIYLCVFWVIFIFRVYTWIPCVPLDKLSFVSHFFTERRARIEGVRLALFLPCEANISGWAGPSLSPVSLGYHYH